MLKFIMIFEQILMIDYQAQFLNTMLKKSKLQTSFTKTLLNFIIQSIPIQDIRRTKLQTSLIYLHYLIDYLILWVLIGLIYNTQSLLAFDWPFIIIRGALSISFIIFKHPWIMMLQKIAVVLQITMAERSFIFLEAVAVFMEITMAAVWSLTKEQRMVHFDSKFQIFGGFLKQTTIYTCILIQSFFSRGSDSDDRQFLLISSILLVLIIDTSQIYYSHVTKALFLQLDFALILIGLLTIFRDTVQMGYSQFLFASIFLFIMVGIHLKLAPNQQNLRQDFNFHQIKGLPEEGLIEIIIKIKNNIASKDSDAIQTYFFKLKQETEDEKLLQKIQQCEQKSNEDKRQLINNFIFQTLKRAVKNSHRLKDLIIYLYSPSPRLYSFLDLQDWQHLREYKRIIAEQKNDVILREAEAEKQLQQIKKLIEDYYKISCVLYQQLMKDRIKQQKVQQYGEKLVCQLQQLQKIKQLGTSSEAIKDLINRFVLSCLPAKYQEPIMMNNQIEPQRLTEEAGSIVFGGQQDNQFRILDTNQCLTKLIYTKKEKYLKKPLSQILPPEFVQNLTLQIKRYNTKEGIDHHQQQKYCYIFNDLGFAVICRYKIQPTTHKTGRAWKLSLKQQYHERSMLIISKANRYIQGFTQLSRYLGLQLSAKKKVVRQDIFNILCNGSNSQLKKGQCLYNQGNQFARNTSIIFLDEIRYLSSTSFIIEMRTNEMNAKSIALPLKKHQQSQQVVNFQFHFNWQGPKIVNRQQPQQIRLRDQYKQYKLINIDYAYEITEMRYFREKIDYKSNFQQERDCPSLQPQIQKALTSLSIEQFFQKWERKRQTVPFWFKLSVFLMFLLFIFSLAGSIFFIISFNSEVDKTINIIQTSCKLHQKFQSVIILSQMTTLPHYNASIDTESSINNQTTYTNDLSSELFFLDQNIFNNPMGQIVLDNFNTLNLYINQYLLNSKHPYDNILSLVSQTIYPNFTIFINNFIDLFGNISTNQIRNIVLIACIIICVLLIALIKLIDYRQRQRRKQVAQILKFIDNNDLSIMKEKITKFKEIWIDNIDGRELDQFIENDEQSSSPPKHLIIDWHFAKRNLFYILWLGAFITLLTLANISISNFQNITSNYISFNHHLSSQISDLQVIWTQYNAVTPNKTFIQSLATSNLENQFQKNTKLKIMAGSLQVDPIFIQNYGTFWQTQRICNYIDDPQCLSILGGAMAEGANMAICYLNIQHDGYLTLNLSNFALYNQSTALSVGRLSFFYLPQFTKINNIYILDQLNLTAKQYKENVQYFCIGVIFVSLSSIIILFWTINERKKNNRLDQLLMIMPFEKLKNFSAFHKYYQRYYLSY